MLDAFFDHIVLLILIGKFSSAIISADSTNGRTELSLDPRVIGAKGFDGFRHAFAL
jgi:hypothetical protein